VGSAKKEVGAREKAMKKRKKKVRRNASSFPCPSPPSRSVPNSLQLTTRPQHARNKLLERFLRDRIPPLRTPKRDDFEFASVVSNELIQGPARSGRETGPVGYPTEGGERHFGEEFAGRRGGRKGEVSSEEREREREERKDGRNSPSRHSIS